MFSLPIHNHRSLSWNFLVFNLLAFVFIKLVFSSATFQLATLLDATPAFGSREIITDTNEARLAQGLPTLATNHKLDLAAQEKLANMAENEYFSHVSPDGTTPWYWIKKSGYSYIVAGENLAIGFLKSQDTVDAWLKSPTHRSNLLSTTYREIGVAVGTVKIDDHQGVLVVQMFGSPTTRPIASENESVLVASALPSDSDNLQPTTEGAFEVQQPDPTVIPNINPEPVVALQYVSTNENLPPISQAVVYEERNSSDILDLSNVVNNIYAWYTFLIAMISIIITVFINRSRMNILKSALHTAIFVGAVLVPSLGPAIRAFIF